MKKKKLDINPVKLILPKAIFDYFEVLDIKKTINGSIFTYSDSASVFVHKNGHKQLQLRQVYE